MSRERLTQRPARRTVGAMTGVRVALATLVAVLASGCSETPADPAVTAEQIEQIYGKAQVVYEVTGKAPDFLPKARRRMTAAITLATPTGTEQNTVWLPLTNQAGTEGIRLEFDRGAFVYVSAQNQGEWGSVTCRIMVDDRVISENTSSGSYGIATCQGST